MNNHLVLIFINLSGHFLFEIFYYNEDTSKHVIIIAYCCMIYIYVITHQDKSARGGDSVFGGDYSTLDRLDRVSTTSSQAENKIRTADESHSELEYGDDQVKLTGEVKYRCILVSWLSVWDQSLGILAKWLGQKERN